MENEEKDLPLYELKIDDEGMNSINFISIVDAPAMESDFMFFSKQEKVEFTSMDEEKKIITGAILIPGKKIYRRTEELGEFNVIFSEETIRQAGELYLKNHKQANVSLQHQTVVNDIFLFESWFIEDPKNDKASALGFSELPKGTWMATMKVNNDIVWNEIKNGNANGFSIEGFLSMQELNMGEIEKTEEKTEEIIEEKISNVDSSIEELIEMIDSLLDKNDE